MGPIAAEENDDGNPPQAQQTTITETAKKRNINSYYESNNVGYYHTASLILNAGLMLYAHLGLSGVILTSLDPSVILSAPSSSDIEGNSTSQSQLLCSEQDLNIWQTNDGESSLPSLAEYCITTYNNNGCFTNSTCTQSCVQQTQNYSTSCSTCFGSLPSCGIGNGCFVCITNSESVECLNCLEPCVEEFYVCSGLPRVNDMSKTSNETTTTTKATASGNLRQQECNNFDLDSITTWYNTYNLTFVGSVKDSWNNDAKLLSVIIVLFSGIWPYVKNILLIMVWYLPLELDTQTSLILWLSRLSKYTLVDVFAVIGILVGVQLQLNIGGVGLIEAVVRAEPRFAIICFFLATAWEFVQIEVVKATHERKVLKIHDNSQHEHHGQETLLFPKIEIPLLIHLVAITLYAGGSVSELMYISTTDYGSTNTCINSYNLPQLGNALITKLSMTDNNAAGQTWFLYLVYVLLCLVLPILVHLLQMAFIMGRIQSKTWKTVIQVASVAWCFAGIEVLLIGIFAVQSKFDQFIVNVANIENDALLGDIMSGLGNGFYILIVYSVVACFLQFSLGIRSDRHEKGNPV